MTWWAVGTAVVGAAGSYLSSKKAGKGGGKVDTTTSTSPWAPSEDYRLSGMKHAFDLMGGTRDPATGRPNAIWGTQPAGSAQPTGGAPAAGGGGGGKGSGKAGGAARPIGGMADSWKGVTPGTTKTIGALQNRAQQGHELYDPSNEFVQNLLAGEDPNAYRRETFDELRGMDDADLRRFKDMLFAGEMPGGGVSSGRGGGGGVRANYATGGVDPGAANLIGVDRDIRAILDGRDLNTENPHVQAMIDAMSRDVQREFSEVRIPGINDEFAGAGRFGPGLYTNALGQAAGEYTTALGDVVGGVRYNEYEARKADQMAALGLGTQYDISAQDRASQDAASSRASMAAGGASASESADRMALARMGALQDAIGMGMGQSEYRLSGMGGLSEMYANDQMGALGMVPGLSGLDIRDLGAAGELSLGGDRSRIDWGLGLRDVDARNRATEAQERASRHATSASAGNARAGLEWDRERYYREAPMTDAMRYADLINAYSGGYGSERTQGYDSRAAGGSGTSAIGQGLMGGLAGWQMGSDYAASRRPQQATGGTAPAGWGLASMYGR